MTMRIQRCAECGALNYPARSLCRVCLADALVEIDDPGAGRLLAVTTLHRSFEPGYAAALPLRVGTVLLDSGPHLMCFLADGLSVGDPVRIAPGRNALGEAVWRAGPA